MSQKELAGILNSTQRNVSNWESGYNEPDFETIIKIAKYFEVSMDYLFGTDDSVCIVPAVSDIVKSIFRKVRGMSKEKQNALNDFLNIFDKSE